MKINKFLYVQVSKHLQLLDKNDYVSLFTLADFSAYTLAHNYYIQRRHSGSPSTEPSKKTMSHVNWAGCYRQLRFKPFVRPVYLERSDAEVSYGCIRSPGKFYPKSGLSPFLLCWLKCITNLLLRVSKLYKKTFRSYSFWPPHGSSHLQMTIWWHSAKKKCYNHDTFMVTYRVMTYRRGKAWQLFYLAC
jgi:hypothetical protein